MKNLVIISLISGTILIIGLGIFISLRQPKNNEQSATGSQSVLSLSSPTPMTTNSKNYTAVLETLEGKITIKLNNDQTPVTVNNFVTLAKKDFYNNTVFHRVIKGFMIQGGDPNGDGTGGPGYKFDDEPFTGNYVRGTVAMANSGPNTNGSQFFIMQADYPLPHQYVIFGQVTEGMEVVDKIADAPVKPVTVQTVTINEE